MPAYVVVMREEPLRDEAEYAEYQRLARLDPGPVPLKALAVAKTVESLEGDKPESVVIMEFPTIEDARAWYYSPAYQAAVPHRLAAARYRTVLVEGL